MERTITAELSSEIAKKDGNEGAEELMDAVGQIVEGEDGEYYVLVNDDCSTDDLGDMSNMQLVVADDGSETLVIETGKPTVQKSTGDAEFFADQVDAAHDYADPRSKRRDLSDSKTASDYNTSVQFVEDDYEEEPLVVGAVTTAESWDSQLNDSITVLEPIPQGMKMRRNRVYGSCTCPECGQSFVNTARLERHLAVHQVFGSYLCPICGKTYKYEYNLFYHWRRTCRELNQLLPVEQRKSIDVLALRQLVDEVAQKKMETSSLVDGGRRFIAPPLSLVEQTQQLPIGTRGNTCIECGVVILAAHMNRHMAVHKGEQQVDAKSVCGGFFCDLCGLMFRQHENLIKHWRGGCPEIQTQLPEDIELTMDDDALRRMVSDLLCKNQPIPQNRALIQPTTNDGGKTKQPNVDKSNLGIRTRKAPTQDETDDVTEKQQSNASLEKTGTNERPQSKIDQLQQQGEGEDDEWTLTANGAVFADDPDHDEAGGPFGLDTSRSRAKWSMLGGPVQCPECFRSFANAGRLERHLAGFHASYGSHHCILCGNRFKYDYNLLYHCRRSCPYTRAFIDPDVREQMDASSLRKLVRALAQKEIRLAPEIHPAPRLPTTASAAKKTVIATTNAMAKASRYPASQPPAHLLVPRPGLAQAKPCPVCSIIFYGVDCVDRHMKAAHPAEWNGCQNADNNDADGVQGQQARLQDLLEVDGRTRELESPPPMLDVEKPDEQPIIVAKKRVNPIVEQLDEQRRAQMDNVQEIIDSGQLRVTDGDQIMLVEGDELSYGEQVQLVDVSGMYKRGPIKRRRSSRFGSNVDGNETDVDPGLEVAEILTGMKDDDLAARSARTSNVVTASFQEELDVGSGVKPQSDKTRKVSKRSSEYEAEETLVRRSTRKVTAEKDGKSK